MENLNKQEKTDFMLFCVEMLSYKIKVIDKLTVKELRQLNQTLDAMKEVVDTMISHN